MMRTVCLLAVLAGVDALKMTSKSEDLVTSCEEVGKSTSLFTSWAGLQPEEYYSKSIKGLCERPEYVQQVDTWVNPKFRDNYKKLYGSDGWIDEAYVVYYSLPKDDIKKSKSIMTQMTWLLKSVQKGSNRPVVAFDFSPGESVSHWSPEEYNRTVVMHARPMHKNAVFNFNKFRAMMLSKVRTGIMLDADQFIGPAADNLFSRIKEEQNEDYPYIIMPVHWFSRDPDPKFPVHPYEVYDFTCKGCPERTMRWGHAHPTFTFHSLPFLSKWLLKTLDHERLGDEPLTSKEDEDVMNMALWAEGANKQWCKFDVPFEDEFLKYIKGGTDVQLWKDPKWFPEGIPTVFYTAHHAVEFEKTAKILNGLMDFDENLDVLKDVSFLETSATQKVSNQQLLEMMNAKDLPPPIFYRGKYYNNGKELKAEHPNLRCIV